jgi:hypothetical protein
MEEETTDSTACDRLHVVLEALFILIAELEETPGGSRGRSLAITKLQEGTFWLATGISEECETPS